MNASDILPARYRDARPIGSGGMGEIFLARDEELGREVAVKVLSQRYAQDEALRARFKREALAAARLSGNPNIVTIYDVDEHAGRPLIVMEYMAGGTLEERACGKGSCPPGQVIEWLEDAASALDAAHEAGVVHRDVKPANLLLDRRGRVQVGDFGIASASGMDSFTQAGTILGTAGYLSPEQAKGERASASSDLYSLAVVAWELLVGRRPFEAETATAEAAAHVTAPIPSVHGANASVPAAFDPIFQRALAKDPAARYASAAEFVGDLRRALHDDAGDTWIEPPMRGTHVAAAPARARRWWIPVLGALLVAAGALAAVVLARDGEKKAEPKVVQPKATTVVHTVTGAGTTVRQTVTAQPPPPPTTEPTTTAEPTTAPTTTAQPAATTTAPAVSGSSGSSLNDQGYTKMRAGDYSGALPLLEQAVAKLSGTGGTTEAYASYNLAYTRYALGQCSGVLALLDRSEAIQGARSEITRLRSRAQTSCG